MDESNRDYFQMAIEQSGYDDHYSQEAVAEYLGDIAETGGASVFDVISKTYQRDIMDNNLTMVAGQTYAPETFSKFILDKEMEDMTPLTPEQAFNEFGIKTTKTYARDHVRMMADIKATQEELDAEIAPNVGWNHPVNTVAAFATSMLTGIGPATIGLTYAMGAAGAAIAGPAGAGVGAAAGAVTIGAKRAIAAARYMAKLSRLNKVKGAGAISSATRGSAQLAAKATQIAAKTAKPITAAPFTKQALAGGTGNAFEEVLLHKMTSSMGRPYDLKTAAFGAFLAPAILGAVGKGIARGVELSGIPKAIKKAEIKAKVKLLDNISKRKKLELPDEVVTKVKQTLEKNDLEVPSNSVLKDPNYWNKTQTTPQRVVKRATKDDPIEFKEKWAPNETIVASVQKDMNRFETLADYGKYLDRMVKKVPLLKDGDYYKHAKQQIEVYDFLDTHTKGKFSEMMHKLADGLTQNNTKIDFDELLPHMKDMDSLRTRLAEMGVSKDNYGVLEADDVLDELFDVGGLRFADYMDKNAEKTKFKTNRDYDTAGKAGDRIPADEKKMKDAMEESSRSADETIEALGDNGKDIVKAIDDFVGCLGGKTKEAA